MPCKTECDGASNVGRGQKIKYKAQMITENTLLSKAQVVGAGKGAYIGFLRFDSKFCTSEVLKKIESQEFRLDVGDKIDNAYVVESATHVPNPNGNDSGLMVQFRRRSGFADLATAKHDNIYVTLSGHGLTSDVSKASAIECFDSMLISTMPDDKGDDFSADYTKCLMYDRFNAEVDWSEVADTTAKPSYGSQYLRTINIFNDDRSLANFRY